MTNFSGCKILIIGDIMLDRYVYGDVTRISPEAPTQVLDIGGTVSSIGAAANCAKNITALGAEVTLISVIGDDDAGREITKQVGAETGITPYLLTEKDRRSTVKTRYVSGHYQLLRADWEYDADIEALMEDRIICLVKSEIASHDVVILSDYDKGVLTARVVSEIIKMSDKPVIVDPKKADWTIYAGATVLTPNLNEWFIASGRDFDASLVWEKAVDCNIGNILVTRSRDGVSLVCRDGESVSIPAEAKMVMDVTGAGDTVVAVLALGMASGMTLLDSAKLANKAGGIVVGKLRTATVTIDELAI